jgi:hypothetical protein
MDRLRVFLLVVVMMMMLGGCTPARVLGMLIAPEKVNPVFELADVTTLIMVDDPRGELGGDMNMAVLADRVMQDLKAKKVISVFVLTIELNKLKDKLGGGYAKAPIDRIGRKLGAKQVIYIKVQSLTLEAAPSMLRPQAGLSMKVIDVEASRRVFPLGDYGSSGRSYDYQSVMQYRFEEQTEQDPRVKGPVLREFCSRIGRDTGRLFYSYVKDPPGKIYER